MAILMPEQDYRKVDESRIQLLKPSDYTEMIIFFHIIYIVMSIKRIPKSINYQKPIY